MEWEKSYNYHSLNVNGLFTIHVDWENGQFSVRYGNWRLKKKFTELEEAKRAAISVAAVKMKKALEELRDFSW